MRLCCIQTILQGFSVNKVFSFLLFFLSGLPWIISYRQFSLCDCHIHFAFVFWFLPALWFNGLYLFAFVLVQQSTSRSKNFLASCDISNGSVLSIAAYVKVHASMPYTVEGRIKSTVQCVFSEIMLSFCFILCSSSQRSCSKPSLSNFYYTAIIPLRLQPNVKVLIFVSRFQRFLFGLQTTLLHLFPLHWLPWTWFCLTFIFKSNSWFTPMTLLSNLWRWSKLSGTIFVLSAFQMLLIGMGMAGKSNSQSYHLVGTSQVKLWRCELSNIRR